MRRSAALLLLVTIPFLSILVNCSSDSGTDQGLAPELPPLNTLVWNFDIIDADAGRIAAGTNWTYSAGTVAVWNTAISLTLAIPVASFAEAFNHEPQFDASIAGWVWEYDYQAFAKTYQARLEAELDTEEITWKMYISEDGIFSDFLWYEGTSKLDGLSGQWVLYKDPTEANPFIQIDWNRNALDGEVAAIRYLNVTPESTDNGSYIFFQADNSEFNRTYDVFSNPQNNLTEIEWNSTSKSGQVKDPNFFEDSDFHCWDEGLEDIDCAS